MEKIKEYFLNTNVFIDGNPYLRNVQRESYERLKNSFEKSLKSHKIVVLPTGTGKTGVMALAPYGICEGRVLIITPSLIIREGISDSFDTRTTFNFWTERKVILNDDDLPEVYRYAGYNKPGDKKRVLKLLDNANIVIANIHKVYNESSSKSLVDILDPDFFDMIIIDEAHHSAANSWESALEYFDCKKIVKLTATPFRADEKDLKGEIVYTYPLADAIKDKVIKNIVSEDYTNEKLEFEIDGRIVSKEEALKEMDSNWVTRSVAYSENCSRTIVKKSIERLNEKRKHGNAFHQIIAVACSIDHAEQIKKLYEEYGLKAGYVSSDRMEETEKVIIAFKKGELDVVVNVDMLGEGFDNPLISVAAIFRPFRSLAPYAQFIGRALRRINKNDCVDEIDNVAHVVYHTELDLDELWKYYSNETQKAKTKKIIELEFIRQEEIERDRGVGNVKSTGKEISNIRTFLDDNVDECYSNAIREEIDKFENKLKEEVNALQKTGVMDEEAIKDFEKSRRKSLDEKVNKRREERRAEKIREELLKRYNDDIVEKVSLLFETKKLSPEGYELPNNSKNQFLVGGDNKAYVTKKINFDVKRKLKRGKDEWETYDFNEAEKLVPIIIEEIAKKIDNIRGEKDE